MILNLPCQSNPHHKIRESPIRCVAVMCHLIVNQFQIKVKMVQCNILVSLLSSNYFLANFLRLYRFMFLYLTQRLIYPLHNKLINRVAVGLKLYVAFLSVEWELLKVHLTRNIKIDCFRVSNFAVIIDSETRILQYNISKIFY